MAVTLEQAKLNVLTDLDKMIIDEYRKSNWLWNNLTFHDCVSPVGGGATLSYSYTRVKDQATAEFREINHEYTPQEATKEQHTVNLAVFGGSYQVDRVIANMGGIVDEVVFQSQQKVKAASALFNETVINGDSGVNHAFDGLEKALKGSSTEFNAGGTVIDLSTTDAIDKNYKGFLDELEKFLGLLDGMPTAILGNNDLIAAIKACGRRTAQYQTSLDDFGRQIATYGGVQLVPLGTKSGKNEPVVGNKAGVTDLYAVRLGMDGFHAISMAGQPPVKIWLPDFTKAGAVKTGEVEMVAAVALKATKAAGVMRNIKVAVA